MSKTFKYVKDFDFSSSGKTVGYYKGGCVTKANGGVVGRAMSAKKGNAVAAIGKQEAAVMKSRMMPQGSGMHKDTSSLGIKGNKNPGIQGSKPVAPKQPAGKPYAEGGYADGGKISKMGEKKIPKVMSEFKSGELHSGSKTGPVVKNRKQAVAIALSEARAASKKK